MNSLDFIDSEVILKKHFVRNINDNVNGEDIIQLFGLDTTKYLQRYCHVEIKQYNLTRYAVVTVPEQLVCEMIKLSAGIEFYGVVICIEEDKSNNNRLNKKPQQNHRH